MKKYLIFLFSATLLLPLALTAQEKTFTVHGTVADHSMDGGYLTYYKYILFGPEYAPVYDSVKVVNGTFAFSGQTDNPYLTIIAKDERIWARFIAEPGDIYVTIDPTKEYHRADVSGTPINDDYREMIVEPYNAYYLIMEPLEKKRKEGMLAGTWTTDDEDAYMQADPGQDSMMIKEKEFAFIDKYIHEPDVVKEMVLWSLYDEAHNKRMSIEYFGEELPYRYAAENARFLEKLSPARREEMMASVDFNVNYEAELMKKLANGEITAPEMGTIKEVIPEPVQVGKPFTDFSATTSEGKPFSLGETVASSRLVMLDFWASWCIPCMKMMPEVAALNEKYKDKGLTIVGISSDDKEQSWRRAMERAGMVWTQVRSGGDDDRVGDAYGIRTIPYTILIDHNGTIVARALRGQELADKIAELLE